MPLDLTPYLNPATTAVIALEVQENLLPPDQAMIPGVAAHASSIGLIPTLAGLLASARRVRARWCTSPMNAARTAAAAPTT